MRRACAWRTALVMASCPMRSSWFSTLGGRLAAVPVTMDVNRPAYRRRRFAELAQRGAEVVRFEDRRAEIPDRLARFADVGLDLATDARQLISRAPTKARGRWRCRRTAAPRRPGFAAACRESRGSGAHVRRAPAKTAADERETEAPREHDARDDHRERPARRTSVSGRTPAESRTASQQRDVVHVPSSACASTRNR